MTPTPDTAQPILQFEPFISAVEPTFWHALSRNKIDLYRLDDAPRQLIGYYSTGQIVSTRDSTVQPNVAPAKLCVSSGSFDGGCPPFTFPAPGTLINTNTIEEFKKIDKMKIFRETAEQIWSDIVSGRAVADPSVLCRFLVLTFADLKKYRFHYWFGFPALLPPEPILVKRTTPIAEALSQSQIASLRVEYDALKGADKAAVAPAFFVLHKRENDIKIGNLSELDAGGDKAQGGEIMVGFVDPSGLSSHPGWPLRNFLILLKKRWNIHTLRVLCYRESLGKGDTSASIVLDIEIPGEFKVDECPKSVGWEKSAAGKLGSRLADLAPLMDPERLADTAVDLNLKLMRWRIMPSLQLEKIVTTKCLLLGSGTLGCYVARSLMAWGIRHISFVDNGRVSFSNPVRQPLFTFEDSLDGGRPKAVVAAENLRKVFPGVNATGHNMSIPMPGHNVESAEKTKADIETLRGLIDSHDAVFLLMDSRESRWLPTLLGASLGKIVINSALGFDSFLVMRHGMRVEVPTTTTNSKTTNIRLGCYFCNDVVAPADSLSDRTLDQQCTVTRPGLSAIASASAVELLVSILNHPDGPAAPPDTTLLPSEPTPQPLGLVPHQIRGFLTHFANLLLVGHAYDKCTACSDTVLSLYHKEGNDFLLRALASPDYLEEVTGLKQMHKETEEAAVEWDIDVDAED
ncbi:hypothetical protein SpCBS45565_g03085 [Spizellomyces sp. 'palustris']|nr:hypothetical protein SpCBS45565_g03085 [Spizellomyces sp. 'palustris']